MEENNCLPSPLAEIFWNRGQERLGNTGWNLDRLGVQQGYQRSYTGGVKARGLGYHRLRAACTRLMHVLG